MKIAVDASAILAVLLDEADSEYYLTKLLTANWAWISPANWWEVQVRMRSRYGEAGEGKADSWMQSVGITVEPITLVQTKIAVAAFAESQGRPTRLNLGDCFAYALARSKNVPLLYKGNDFAQTDVLTA